ncbi:glycosyltransferase family 2 protein [Paenibacillus sediminis]|uniref:GT2 family glycosyltransferase n=1 Tax=Paenibacillus sediminis TaxID=664909 RepID=A0ABS4H5R3_9BACL|nr:glycosyltransferase family 2 protein [Paenibacillus sediminis]MBP1937879.1 GT2 family glycosyltransferase [Paenibacillus sediminis]
MTFTSIIIPTHNGLHLLNECVESIRKYTQVPYEIVIVDNGSNDGTLDYCLQENMIFVSLATNTGFASACNKGIAAASGDDLLLLHNDVIVSDGWLKNLTKALHSDEQVGIVGPIANVASRQQQVKRRRYSYMSQFHRLSGQYNRSNRSKWKYTNSVDGFCFLFKREVMDKVGSFDERFSPGYYEDDDYCLRARVHGYKILVCGDVLVHHEGGATFHHCFPNGIDEIKVRNQHVFMDKWYIDPHKLS